MKKACVRCGHEWFANSDHRPMTCPKCRSPYWDRERVRIMKRRDAYTADTAAPRDLAEAVS